MSKVNAGSSSHVHFPDDQIKAHDSEIVVQSDGSNRFDVHLGFLQFNHRYHIFVNIQDSLGETVTSEKQASDGNIMLLEATTISGGHRLHVDFKAYQEKLMQELIVLVNKDDKSKTATVVFHARVLGKGQGTPALREGIHCVATDESVAASTSTLPSAAKTS